jgi:hypothetical protein
MSVEICSACTLWTDQHHPINRVKVAIPVRRLCTIVLGRKRLFPRILKREIQVNVFFVHRSGSIHSAQCS